MSIIDSTLYREQLSLIAEEIPKVDATILVTGATGMIGSCLVDALLYADVHFGNHLRVIALGRSTDKLLRRFAYESDTDRLRLAAQDICEPLSIDEPIDYILHAASNADPVSYALYPAETLLTNLVGTKNVLDYCKDHPKTRLLFTSTFEVYGRINEKADGYRETDSGEIDLNAIRSCYPESKRCAEILMRCYQKEYNVDFVIARLCSIYGPTMAESDSKAHAQFLRNGLEGQDIVLKSKGLQKRTYCYLLDTVKGIFFTLFRGKSGEAYNISYEKSVASIAEVAETVACICGTKVVYDLPSAIESQGFSRPQDCVLNNDKLKELGWTGSYTLEEGLRSTIAIIRQSK
ncbi:MAG: NAD-dependent epimerase/dehydratase family protein [Clostridia bacterium]|nr:NAD-dependent epimerase/dehydratase family protein [Clostridia bacterium]